MIEPDPVVENLSWPVLPSPSGPLGVAYPVEEVRSILVLENGLKNQYVRGQNHDAEPGSPLVVAASVVGEGEPPLPETLIEAENVKRYLRAPKMLLGGQATTADVGAGLASATVWHFAGHARQSGNGTELLLAEAGGEHRPWIDGAFLRSHPPRVCRLAILSACATGRREAAWNHPLQDIVATLESLGVPEVVATRWQIDSEASVPFMDNLYLHLAKGETVAMALSSARRVQSEKSLYKNPYYWGAYYLSGRENTITQGELHASFYKENEINQETAQADLRH
jgi:CHAT domain-containing protein